MLYVLCIDEGQSVKHKFTTFPWGAIGRTIALITILAFTLGSKPRAPYSSHEKAFFADPNLVQFVQPGLVFKVTAAAIAADGTITATVSVQDPSGLPLDRLGITTPGVVTLNFIAATIPKGQEQYTAYTTRVRTGALTGKTVTVAGADTGGTYTQNSDGTYTYKFATKAPTGFDALATTTIGVYGSRNLTVYGLPNNNASTTYNFISAGGTVTVTRDVVKSTGCNNCHDQISFHGGSRRGVELCVLCHTPQSSIADTGQTVDFKVMIHKIHEGSSLPSVVAGGTYAIGSTDWSTVVYPADVRRCETCHQQDQKAAQATAYLTQPSRLACGSCHDNIDFAKGTNHVGGPQFDDKLCSTCHIPQGSYDFDASIKGGHVIPTESSLLGGIAITLTKVSSGTVGAKPVVAFTLKDGSGAPLPLKSVASLSFTMTGPTTDYGLTSFGSDVTTPGYVTESATSAANPATCGADGTCLYTFLHAIPPKATGTFTIGVESRRSETVLPGTTIQQTIQYGAKNQVIYFSVDGSKVAPRRSVVATANCNRCHVALSLHGGLRNQTEYCVICHNPSGTDSPVRGSAVVAADKALPPQGINFNLLVHRIHTGENLPANRPYVVVGFGGSHNDFSDVRYPAMNANGNPGDTRNCSICHVNSSQLNLPAGLNSVTDPQGPINPDPPITAACTGCHVDISTASHAFSNQNQLGEACPVCHAAGAAFAVDQVHTQY